MTESIGTRLRRLRKAASVTQAELSESTGIPQSTISQYESGKFAPSRQALATLAEALIVHPGAIEFGSIPQDAKLDSSYPPILDEYLASPEGLTVTEWERTQLARAHWVGGEPSPLMYHYILMALREAHKAR